MAVSRAKKVAVGEKLGAELQDSSSIIVGTFSKLTVAQDFELRKTVRSAGAKYQVVKNSIAELVSKGTPVEAALQNLSGVNSIAYTSGDPVALAKALAKYAKANPEYQVKHGGFEGRLITSKEVEALSSMPPKEEIQAKLLFLINAPAQQLVTVMNAVGRDLAVVVDQGVKENKFKASPGDVAAAKPVVAETAEVTPIETAPAAEVVEEVKAAEPVEAVAEVAEVAAVKEEVNEEVKPEEAPAAE